MDSLMPSDLRNAVSPLSVDDRSIPRVADLSRPTDGPSHDPHVANVLGFSESEIGADCFLEPVQLGGMQPSSPAAKSCRGECV
jgi:hypothetical protein